MDSQTPGGAKDYSKYQGKNLFRLLMALIVQTMLLYFRIALSFVASASRVSEQGRVSLQVASTGALILFLISVPFAARILTRQFRPAATRKGSIGQYIGMLFFSAAFSIIAAVVLEGFGYAVLSRSLPILHGVHQQTSATP